MMDGGCDVGGAGGLSELLDQLGADHVADAGGLGGGGGTVSREVSRQMADAMGVIERLRADNEQFSYNFEQLKAANVQLKTQLGDAKKTAAEAVEAKRRVEQTHHEICESLQSQLEAKCRELDEFKEATIPSREIERLRLKLLQELEQPHQEKCRSLEEALEKYKSTCFSLKRECELAKTEVEHMRMELRKHESTQTTKNSTEQELRNRISSMQSCIEEYQKNDSKMVLLGKENTDLQQRQKELLNEIEEHVARAEKLQHEREHTERLHARQIVEERAVAKAFQVEKETLEHKVSQLQRELDDAHAFRERSAAQIASLEQQQHHNKTQMTSSLQASELELNTLKRQYSEERNRWKKDKASLLKQLDESRQRYQDEVKKEQLLNAQLLAFEQDSTSRVRTARAEDADRVTKLQAEVHLLEHKILQGEQEKMEMNALHVTEVTKLREELKAVKNRLEATSTEKIKTEQRLEEWQEHATSMEKDLDYKTQMLNGIVNENLTYHNQLQESTRREQGLLESKAHMDSNLEWLESELRAEHSKLHTLEQFEAMYNAEAEKVAVLSQQLEQLALENKQLERKCQHYAKKLQGLSSEPLTVRTLHTPITPATKAQHSSSPRKAHTSPASHREPPYSTTTPRHQQHQQSPSPARTQHTLNAIARHLESLDTLQNQHLEAISGVPSTPHRHKTTSTTSGW
ncbi:centrosomal protein of 83 kDa [Pelomyxa schiedti]|nr:centrosomal protein of 83 kDa [Pelomyxa schiedti]